MKNRKKFNELMTAIAEIFDKTISEPLLMVYWKLLEPFSDEDAIRALNLALTSCKFFPKPADILEHLQGKQEDQAIQAWVLVDEAMRRHGNYVSLNFGDPKIHRVIELMGGWEYLGTLDEKEWTWKRKEFESAYRAIVGEGGPPKITGFIEQRNRAQGFDFPETLQIGEKKGRPLQLVKGGK